MKLFSGAEFVSCTLHVKLFKHQSSKEPECSRSSLHRCSQDNAEGDFKLLTQGICGGSHRGEGH